jgi:hypothetical protein
MTRIFADSSGLPNKDCRPSPSWRDGVASSSSSKLDIATASMSRTTIDIMGSRFVLIPAAILKRQRPNR